MSKRFVAPALVVTLAGAGAWAFAQQGRPAPTQTEPPRYTVATAGNSAVMVETTTGKTWFLQPGNDDMSVLWLPIERIDDPAHARKLLEERKAALEKR